MAYKIDTYFCVGCEACYQACEFGAVEIVVEEHNCIINPDNCVECGACVNECPIAVITPEQEEVKAQTEEKTQRAEKEQTVKKEQTSENIQSGEKWAKVWIEESECIGCSKCQRNCPADAIEGVKKQPFRIDGSKCIKCGLCITNCPKHAVYGKKE